MIRYMIPLPVSTNALHEPRKGGGKRRSDAYNAWIGLAGANLCVQRAAHLKAFRSACIAAGPWQVEIRAGRPDKRRRDVDNLVKATLDLLVKMQLAPDDSECVRVTLEWAAHDRPEAEVILRPYDLTTVARSASEEGAMTGHGIRNRTAGVSPDETAVIGNGGRGDEAAPARPTWDEIEALVQEIGSDYGFSRSPEAQGAIEAIENLLTAIKERRNAIDQI